MARLARYNFQLTGLDTSQSAVQDSAAVIASGITNTGNISATGSIEAVGPLILTADNNKRVQYTAKHMGGTVYALTPTEL